MAGILGLGAKFGIKVSATYPDLAEVLEITPAELVRDTVETTHFGSTEGYREFIGGLRDAGEYEVTLLFTPAAAPAIHAFFEAVSSEAQITWPNGIREQFAGVVTSWNRTLPMDDRLQQSFRFKVSGQPAFLAAA